MTSPWDINEVYKEQVASARQRAQNGMGGPLVDKWDKRWMRLAWEVSSWASCLRAKAGAVAVTHDNRPISLAYNGAPQGMPSCVELGDCIQEGGHCINCLHVEDNIVLFAERSLLVGAKLYITMTPCVRCANKLIQAKFSEIVYDVDYANGTSKSLERFKSAGIVVRRVHVAR
jgi:dCMP deaminase